MIRSKLTPRTYRLRAWLCDRIAPPDYRSHKVWITGLWDNGEWLAREVTKHQLAKRRQHKDTA